MAPENTPETETETAATPAPEPQNAPETVTDLADLDTLAGAGSGACRSRYSR